MDDLPAARLASGTESKVYALLDRSESSARGGASPTLPTSSLDYAKLGIKERRRDGEGDRKAKAKERRADGLVQSILSSAT